MDDELKYPPVKPLPWVGHEDQIVVSGDYEYRVPRLIQLAENLPVYSLPLIALNMDYTLSGNNLREVAGHMEAVEKADLTKPILLDENGQLLDGCHRIVKALLQGDTHILAKRFESNPRPDIDNSEGGD